MNKLIAWCLLLAVHAASAQTVCRLVSSTSLAFGSYDMLSGSPRDSLSTVDVNCSRNGGPQNVVVTLGLDPGMHGTSVSARRMAHTGGSGDYLSYGLFRDVGRSSVWGYSAGMDAVSQVVAVPNNGSASTTFTIFGRIPALQNVTAGTYTDSVRVTLTP